MKKLTLLYQVLGYHFKNPLLLEEALTHPSVSLTHRNRDRVKNYERLEFLGDGVLGLIIAELLFYDNPDENEGGLAKRQSALVRGETVAQIASTLGIGEFIIMTEGEESMGGRNNANNMENTLEAIIGAIYLDGGLDPAKQFILTHWQPVAQTIKEPPKDPKTLLQEWAQYRGLPIPGYRTVTVKGPSHAPLFTIEVSVEGYPPIQATGATKKVAEKAAANLLFSSLIAHEPATSTS